MGNIKKAKGLLLEKKEKNKNLKEKISKILIHLNFVDFVSIYKFYLYILI